MASKRNEVVSVGSRNLQPFPLDAHREYGRYLKRMRRDLERMSGTIKASFPNCNKTSKDIEIARQALERVQLAMHGRLLNGFREYPDSELLPIYLGRLEELNRGLDEE
jgi:hypothetical protein